jgi:uncharacterized protein
MRRISKMYFQKLLLLTTLPVLALGMARGAQTSEAARGIVVANRTPLQANAFNPLPLGAVRPRGWLKRQEEIQAGGLTGHLDEFWNDVGPNSGWLGGTGEAWERGPYYLDGLLPLACQLDDLKLIEKAKRWVDWTLSSQTAEGNFGPGKNDDWWPRMVMLKVLTQYEEATGDPRVIPFMTKYFEYEGRHLPGRPLRDWGKYRWQDNAYSVLWLYNRTGAVQLLSLVKLLHQQGYDWERQFNEFVYTAKQTKESVGLKDGQKSIPDTAMQTHGVNNAMALKAAPVWWLVSGAAADRSELNRQLAMLDTYHGLPNGIFSADEHLAGTDPSQGTELCTVVETMFSYEDDFAILGSAQIADRLERVAYNALPATLSNDMWSHQYDQQPNQIACTRAHRQWSTNGPDSNLFGLAPNFGCCTANLHQGWPKFVSSLWMATANGGLVTVAYAPSEVRTSIRGKDVSIQEDTLYPFRGSIQLKVHLQGTAAFPIVLRIPAWAESAAIQVNGSPTAAASNYDVPKGFFPITRNWKDGDTVTIDFPMQPRVTHSYNNSVVFERGPLVFALPLDGTWTELKHYAQKSGDWEVKPSRAWNYALETGNCDATVEEHPVTDVPFDVMHPAVSMKVHGKRLPEWGARENSAAPVPVSPVSSKNPAESLRLVPYGAAKVRITAFPFLDQPSHCAPGS